VVLVPGAGAAAGQQLVLTFAVPFASPVNVVLFPADGNTPPIATSINVIATNTLFAISSTAPLPSLAFSWYYMVLG
jgi:hypothetical protein